MQQHPGIFPTFFLSGFECSSFDWKDVGRRDLSAELSHYVHADEDYAMLASLGIGVAREGIAWPLVDKGGGEFDFSAVQPFLDAQRRHKVLPIWDLCHYGYPDGLDPLSDAFPERFAAYARAVARHLAAHATAGPLCFTPINEPTFWGYMGGQWGWCAPFGKTADHRRRFTLALARADIAAVGAIREDFPDARFVHIDPLIWVVPPRDRPDLAEEAHRESYEDAYIAWDVISGLKHPEYGGSPETIDILGAQQLQLRADGIYGRGAEQAARTRRRPDPPGGRPDRGSLDPVPAPLHRCRNLRHQGRPARLAQRHGNGSAGGGEPRRGSSRHLPVSSGRHDRLA
jgi:hypothetical protein